MAQPIPHVSFIKGVMKGVLFVRSIKQIFANFELPLWAPLLKSSLAEVVKQHCPTLFTHCRVKRAGLDYWEYVAVRQYDAWQVRRLQRCS